MRAMSFAIIIVIGWLYVTILVAANEPTVITGIISFLFYGAFPCGLMLYFAGSKIRRQRQRYREMMAEKTKETPRA
jgi:TRAP-type C4-dicarboxylate transport system permease small subunit